MKKNATKNIRLGIFINIGILLFISAIYFIGQKKRMFGNTFRLSCIYKDVSGLQVGNNVRFSGINLGTVENITIITDTTVQVDLTLDKSVQKFIKKDAKTGIGSEGLMGNKIVNIFPGTPGGEIVQDNDFLTTTPSINMDEILLKMKTTADNAAIISTDLAGIMSNIYMGKGTIGKLFMDTTLAENIDQTLVNLKYGTGGFKENMDAASHSILLRGFLKGKKKEEKK